MVRKLFGAASALALLAHTTLAGATTTLTLHLEAPAESAWGKVFKAWSNVVTKQTNGAVKLDPKYGGALGTEVAAMAKVQKGEAGGGYFTTRGLSELDRAVLALQVRGAYASWSELDSARSALEPDLVTSFAAQHVALVGWSDVGIGRFLSRGFAVTGPGSLKNRKVALLGGDSVSPKLLDAIGGTTTVPLDVTDVLQRLEDGQLDVVAMPAYPAEQLGWTARLTHVTTDPLFFATGAIVLSQQQLDGLTEEQRALVLETGKRAAAMLDKKLDGLGYASYVRLKEKLETHTLTDAEKAAWRAVFQQACKDLAGGVVPQAALDKTHACE